MRSQLLPYLQISRFPAVFTALADIFLGFVLIADGFEPSEMLVLGLLSSACLYLSGMVWNDIFDRHKDAEERPKRPIPSGRMPVRRAVSFSLALTVAGLVAAAFAGSTPFLIAALLATTILAYDSVVKRTLAGPLAMGLCRSLNVLLGAAVAAGSIGIVTSRTPVWVATGLGVYIVGVTAFARHEASVSRKGPLGIAMLIINLGLAILIGWVAEDSGSGETGVVLVMMAIIALTLNRRLAHALFNPTSEAVQYAVRTCLLTLIVLDATLAYAWLGPDGAGYAIAIVVLLFPAMTVGRLIPMT